MDEKRIVQIAQHQELESKNWNRYHGYNEPDADWSKIVEPGGLSSDDYLPKFTLKSPANEFIDVLETIKGKRVLVIGDIMLDHYVYGKMERQSPEADCKIFDVEREEFRLGGAGNVAWNVVRLGGESTLVGLAGFLVEMACFDVWSETVQELCDDYRIELVLHHSCSPHRPTTVKKRLICDNQQIMRIDNESTDVANEHEQEEICDSILAIIDEFDAVIFSDYDKGVIFPELINQVVYEAKARNIPVIADPKCRNFWNYKGVTAMTPNEKELKIAKSGSDRYWWHSMLDNPLILETVGKDGILLHDNKAMTSIPIDGYEVDVKDICGAGDTVTAAFALALSAKIDPLKAAQFANKAASISVQHYGCYAPTPEDFE